MTTRLSAQDRRRQIMDVATGLFARQGFQGTTTREIAAQAGVNEALLFRHFPNKETLYWTIIEDLCSAHGRRRRVDEILKTGGDDRQVFTALAREILARNERDTELTRLLWFTALENHTLSERFFRTYVADYYESLAGYIQRRISQGGLRPTDPLLAARSFFGMVVYHFLVQELFGGEKYQKFDGEEVAGTVAAIWLGGMQTENRVGSPQYAQNKKPRVPGSRSAGHRIIPPRHAQNKKTVCVGAPGDQVIGSNRGISAVAVRDLIQDE